MTAPHLAVVTIVRGRHSHLAGQVMGLRDQRRSPDTYVVVAVDDPAAHGLVRALAPVTWDLRTPTLGLVDGRMPLSAARNLGAATAVATGAEHLVFLDVDCVPHHGLVERYADVLRDTAGDPAPRVVCGDVAYEPPPASSIDPRGSARRPRHHPARPALPDDALEAVDDVTLFWSLSFAVTATDFERVGGFDEDYAGYGGEDTDFGQRLARAGGRLIFTGGARAVHQYHPTSNPPVQHVADVVANANLFATKWGWWPMLTWLEQFRAQGMVTRADDGRWSTTGLVGPGAPPRVRG